VSNSSKADQVGSGVPYLVTLVHDRAPRSLDDFMSGAVVALTVVSGDQTVCIHGSSRRDGESVVVYEKDHDGVGKDVRTWEVHATQGHFEATERSMY
jgi:phosphoenolpyruvate synthase/pyruvate phosphate dikinase